jgi:hypothetical protein
MRLLALLATVAALADPQTKPETRPQFEVASIKRANQCDNRPDQDAPPVASPGRLELHCATLESLIQIAYVRAANGVSVSARELEITGGPPWVRSEPYDVVAKPESAHLLQMSGPMLQTKHFQRELTIRRAFENILLAWAAGSQSRFGASSALCRS